MKYLPLRYIATRVFVGTTPTRLTQRTLPTKQQPAATEAIEISVVKNGNLNNAGLQIGGIELIQAFDRPSLKKHLLQPTDILLTMRYKDFYCGIAGQQPNPCIAANNLSVFRQIDSNLTSGEYLTVWLRSEPGRKAIASIARPVQTTTSSYSDWSYLTIEHLLDLEVPIPSPYQQQQAIDAFQAIVSLQLRHQTEMRAQLDGLNQLFIPD